MSSLHQKTSVDNTQPEIPSNQKPNKVTPARDYTPRRGMLAAIDLLAQYGRRRAAAREAAAQNEVQP